MLDSGGQKVRIGKGFIYLLILFGFYLLMYGWNISFLSIGSVQLIFFTGGLSIILGNFLLEPFFTKPIDVIVNLIMLGTTIITTADVKQIHFYNLILYFLGILFILSIIVILGKDANRIWIKTLTMIMYKIVVSSGSSKFIFSIIFLIAIYSYYYPSEKFIYMLIFYFILIFDLVGFIFGFFKKLFDTRKEIGDELGIAIGCENPYLYEIEIELTNKGYKKGLDFGDLILIEKNKGKGALGMITSSKHLLNKRRLSVYLFTEDERNIEFSLSNGKIGTIFDDQSKIKVYPIDDSKKAIYEEKLSNNELYKNRDNFIGFVSLGSNINYINFEIIRDTGSRNIGEGDILKTKIFGKDTLYQIIDGKTQKEHLEKFDSYGYMIGTARKLGCYNTTKKELEPVKWVPNIYSPLYFAFNNSGNDNEDDNKFALCHIGKLPGTNLGIELDINSLVTHNTAILGILGVGKSCLSFEIIKKVVENNIKVICIDITNEYYKELKNYGFSESDLQFSQETEFNTINSNFESIVENSCSKSGNQNQYRDEVKIALTQFFDNSSSKIKIFNPDYHKVSKGVGFKVSIEPLSSPEKTRIIVEEIFKILMSKGVSEDGKARVLIVFEEAHSLIPEWNSSSNDGDKLATNGTAKIILQGRKYGLGSLVITQRTANISKSILNQCNTIFALRVFDDTGKAFLENYIGKDYANILPTLQERHALIIGRGVKLKQPIIIELNDKKFIITSSSNINPN